VSIGKYWKNINRGLGPQQVGSTVTSKVPLPGEVDTPDALRSFDSIAGRAGPDPLASSARGPTAVRTPPQCPSLARSPLASPSFLSVGEITRRVCELIRMCGAVTIVRLIGGDQRDVTAMPGGNSKEHDD
jgi:hypothetical protein